MLCWQCDDEARATCLVCGRHVCRHCAKEGFRPLLAWRRADGVMVVMGSRHAVHCGMCQVADPIAIPEMDAEMDDA